MVARSLAAGTFLAALAQASPYAMNSTTGGVVYTTEVVTSLETYCPGPTQVTYGGTTYTVTEATTLTITDCPCTISKPVAPTSVPSTPENKCAKDCQDAYNKCRVQPHANMSYCAAKFAECLGHSPFGDDGSLVTPTACSTTQAPATPTGVVYTTEVVTELTTVCPSPTTMTFNNVTYTVSEPTTLTVTDCPCTISKPQPSASQPATPNCPAECSDAYNKCRTAPDANMSFCAAQYAGCLGHSPFGPDGSLITPTACSQAPTGATTAPVQPGVPTTTAPAQPGVPTRPASGPSSTPTFTPVPGSADRVVPGALLALGVFALL